jgi:hypothetical protein
MKSVARRVQALVLTLIFLGGGMSLPSLDVLLFHLHGETSRPRIHIEAADGCASHVGHCAIGCAAAATGALGAAAFAPRFDAIIPSCTTRSIVQVPTLTSYGVGFQSRAPPA